MKNNGQDYIVDLIKNTDDLSKLTGEDLVDACDRAREEVIAHNEEIKNMSFSAKAGQVALQALVTVGNMLVSMAIFKGIELIASANDNYANRVKYAQERLEKFSSDVSESKKELETQEEWIKEHGKRYEELSRGVDNYGHAVSLTADEISEYNSLTKDIESMFPTMVTGYNDQNQAIIKMKGSVDALTESYKANVEAAYADTLAKSSEGFGDYKTAIDDAEFVKQTIETLLNADKITGFVKQYGGFQLKIGDDF